MRSGEGAFKRPDGYLYKGSWDKDMKHGKGEEYLPNGDVIKSEWEYGRLNGSGTLTDKNGKEMQCVWHYDLMIPQGIQNPDCYNRAPLNLVLCLGALAFIPIAILEYNYLFFIGLGVLYVVQIIESMCTSTLKYMTHVIQNSET